MKKALKALPIFLFIVLIAYVVCYPHMIISNIRLEMNYYKNPYLRELKIPSNWKLYALIDTWGEPIEIMEEEINSSYIDYTLKFDGFSVDMNKYDYIKNKDKAPAFERVIIWSEKYRFTEKNIGVGSGKEDIINYYKDSKLIKDLPENQIGYIIDDYWIYFYIDNNDKIEEIRLTRGL